MHLRSGIVLGGLLFSLTASSCASSTAATVRTPISVDLGRFESCTIETQGPFEDGPRATSAFVAYLEGRLREEAVLEPAAPEEAKSAEILIRVRPAKSPSKERVVRLDVEIVDVRADNKVVGAFEVSGEQEEIGGGVSVGPRGIALQRAADAIASTMKRSRSATARAAVRSRAEAAAVAAVPVRKAVDPAEDPFAVRAPNTPRPKVCLSTCELPSSSALADSELSSITTRVDPTLQTLRSCLRRVGAELVEPAVLLRFGDGGRLVGMRVDVGGYEDLTCVSDAWAAPPRVRASRPAIVRCIFHCAPPPPEEP